MPTGTDSATLSSLIEMGIAGGGILGAVWAGFRQARKSEGITGTAPVQATLVSDDAIAGLVKELKRVREESHEDAYKLRGVIGDACENLEELTKAIKDTLPSGTTPAALLALTAKIDQVAKDRGKG